MSEPTDERDDRREGRDPQEPREKEPRRQSRMRGFARRIMGDLDDAHEGDGPRVDARELLGAMLETGDKAKTEIVRMVAREVRSYLEALELGHDLRDLLTEYSLEVHASVHLKPLGEVETGTPTTVGLKRKKAEPEAARRKKGVEPDQPEVAETAGEASTADDAGGVEPGEE